MSETDKRIVLFICEHGSAKSVVAAAHFNKLASEKNFPIRALSRGTNPDEEIPANVLRGLASEELTPGETKPKLLTQDDIDRAVEIVTFCDFPKDKQTLGRSKDWSDVPPISEDYNKARDAIAERIRNLLNKMGK